MKLNVGKDDVAEEAEPENKGVKNDEVKAIGELKVIKETTSREITRRL